MSLDETSGRRRRHLSHFLRNHDFALAARAVDYFTKKPISETWVRTDRLSNVDFTLTIARFDSSARADARHIVAPTSYANVSMMNSNSGFIRATQDGTITLTVSPHLN
jgi:hypothetical protein